jgi:AcrR family transcriptional regulator
MNDCVNKFAEWMQQFRLQGAPITAKLSQPMEPSLPQRSEASHASKDGRIRRGEKSRERILDAMVSLLEEQSAEPTPEELAARAGVSLRTVFNHFGNIEELKVVVQERMLSKILPILQRGSIEGTTKARVHELVLRRVRLYEAIAPFRRRVSPMARDYNPDGERLAKLDRGLRFLTASALELDRSDSDLVELVEGVLSFEHWDRLRHAQGRGARRTARLLERAVLALLGSD